MSLCETIRTSVAHKTLTDAPFADVPNVATSSVDALDMKGSDFWIDLEGFWYRQKDNLCVGEICGDTLIWHAQWKFPSEVAYLHIVSQDCMSLEVASQVLMGKVKRGAQTVIHWSDDDVWLRK